MLCSDVTLLRFASYENVIFPQGRCSFQESFKNNYNNKKKTKQVLEPKMRNEKAGFGRQEKGFGVPTWYRPKRHPLYQCRLSLLLTFLCLYWCLNVAKVSWVHRGCEAKWHKNCSAWIFSARPGHRGTLIYEVSWQTQE